MEVKKYFHKLSQKEIDDLKDKGVTWQDVMNNYNQPDFCGYKNALNGRLGCWSLIDITLNGRREKIGIDYCKNCDNFIKQKPNQTHS